ncbi:MAG: potassium channel family protein [Thermoplasmatota archaeon]
MISLRRIKENKWLIILMFAAIGSILGWIGYYKMYHDDGWTIFDITYVVMRLYLINLNEYGVPIPWELQVGRFILPLVSSYAVVLIVLKLFSEKIKLMKIKRWRNHVVICGLGDKGYLLARDLVKKNKVVVIEKDPNNLKIEPCIEQGITILHGDATQKFTLERANVVKAKYLFAITGSDVTNTEIALKQDKVVSRSTKKSRCTCYVHMKNRKLCDLIEKNYKRSMKSNKELSLKYFNIFDYSARLIFDKFPPEMFGSKEDDEPYHILVFGFGSLGESLVIQALKVGHYPNGKELKITIIDENAKGRSIGFYDRYPEVVNIDNIKLEFMDIKVDESGFFNIDSVLPVISSEPTIAYLCYEDDVNNITTAFQLNDKDLSSNLPVLINILEKVDFASILKKEMDSGPGSSRFHIFRTIRDVCSERIIVRNELDLMAQVIHREYLKKRKEEGTFDPKKPSHRDWERLPEVYKDANRQQSDHIDVKLRAIGCRMKDEIGPGALKKFTEEEVELLGEMEHYRWNAEKYLNDWTLGDDRKKLQSPYLVSWEELSEDIREYDREAVRNIPSILKSAGYGIYRIKSSKGRKKHRSRL